MYVLYMYVCIYVPAIYLESVDKHTIIDPGTLISWHVAVREFFCLYI